ncbi:MAG TPA: hypothetical protein VFY38_13065, partial [Pseudonocardia sp.]|nr:hypothetical protein [Pseudonocardia sp.]
PPAEVTPAAPEVPSRARDRRPMPRRRHALALLGVAGILAGGYAVTDAPPEPPPVQTAPEGAAALDGAAADPWAQRATVTLASVNRQLDTLAQTEDEWRRLPESRRAMVPAPVAALAERRSVLQRRRATLQAQLDDYRSLRRTQQELANSEQHLRAVETALADAPPRRRRSAEQEAALAALEEQRDLRIRRRDVQRTELASLQDGVSTATRTPLPDDGAATAKVTDDVLEMVHNGGTEPARPDPKPPRPEVVAGRESEDGKPRQEVGTSGPPDPRGPRDESDERRAAQKKRAAGVADKDARVAGDARKDPKERRSAGDEADAEKHAQVGRASEKPRDDRASAETHSADGADSGGEKSADKPVEKSAERGHDRQKDRESTDKDATESQAHYRQAEMRSSVGRESASKEASTNRQSTNRGSTDRDATERRSKDRDSQKRDVKKRDSKERDAKKRDAKARDSKDRDARRHHEMKKRESDDRDSDRREKDSDSRGRDSKGRDSEEHGSTEHESTQRESTQRESTQHESTQRESTQHESGDRGARHRHDTDSERNRRVDADKDGGDDRPSRAAGSTDR